MGFDYFVLWLSLPIHRRLKNPNVGLLPAFSFSALTSLFNAVLLKTLELPCMKANNVMLTLSWQAWKRQTKGAFVNLTLATRE